MAWIRLGVRIGRTGLSGGSYSEIPEYAQVGGNFSIGKPERQMGISARKD